MILSSRLSDEFSYLTSAVRTGNEFCVVTFREMCPASSWSLWTWWCNDQFDHCHDWGGPDLLWMWSKGSDLRCVPSHLYSELSTCNQITQDRCLVCVSPLNLFPTVHTTVPGLFVDNPSPLKVLGVFEEERGILGVSWCSSRSLQCIWVVFEQLPGLLKRTWDLCEVQRFLGKFVKFMNELEELVGNREEFPGIMVEVSRYQGCVCVCPWLKALQHGPLWKSIHINTHTHTHTHTHTQQWAAHCANNFSSMSCRSIKFL